MKGFLCYRAVHVQGLAVETLKLFTCSPFTVHCSPFTVHRSSFTVYRSLFNCERPVSSLSEDFVVLQRRGAAPKAPLILLQEVRRASRAALPATSHGATRLRRFHYQ